MRLLIIFLTLCCFWLTSSGWAAPAIVYTGKKEDGVYNQSLHEGVRAFQEKRGVKCLEIETPADGSTYIATIQKCIAENYSPIILPYRGQFPELDTIVSEHPQTFFILLDALNINRPNISAFVFAEHEASFLAGALAALMSRTKTIGFIYTSRQYQPLLRFRAGYIQGALAMNPKIKIMEKELGNYPGVWRDTAKGRKMAAELIAQGVDVLFATAGFAGTGVLAQAARNGIHAIGVDTNQNNLYPETMIGSLVKYTNKAVYIALSQTHFKKHTNRVTRLGLAQQAINIDFDGVRPEVLPTAVLQQINNLYSKILQGRIKIKDNWP